jgi:hypothetical protein
MHPRRTYVYYSDDKILEQKDQVGASRWKRAVRRLNQVGVVVLGTGTTVGLGPPEAEPVLLSMQTLWMDLADEDSIGTFDEPKEWFYGTLDFHYGFFDHSDPPIFFMVGVTERTIVALGGSKKHVRGFRGREIPIPDEAASVVMEGDVATLIYEAMEPGGDPVAATVGEDIRAVHVAGVYQNWKGKGATAAFEVLARKELTSRVSPGFLASPMDVLIGSPLFVAQA